jgi:hypothetical protein
MVALAMTAAVAGPGAATAGEPEVSGVPCGFTVLTADGNSLRAEVDGGPVVVTGAGTAVPVELVCTIQVGAPAHAGPDAVAVRASGPGAAIVPPTLVTFEAAPEQDVILCTEVRVTTSSGVRALYWDDFAEEWSDSPDVGCTDLAPDYDGDPVQPYLELLDTVVCPVLAIVFPPEGDVTGPVLGKVWDCPPYDL